ncbi:MAG TPA: LamG domain-containing protein [Pyrinomonadaceae bacterium]|nr:LamG domain-containing protein [Pyrinomonadaceae bacterium]
MPNDYLFRLTVADYQMIASGVNPLTNNLEDLADTTFRYEGCEPDHGRLYFVGSTFFFHDLDGDTSYENGFTMESWILPSSITNNAEFYFQVGETGKANVTDLLSMRLVSGTGMKLISQVGTNSYPYDRDLNTNEWVHLAITVDANGLLTIYFSGRPTNNLETGEYEKHRPASTLQVGVRAQQQSDAVTYATGMRFYNRALSPAEIQADLNEDAPNIGNQLSLQVHSGVATDESHNASQLTSHQGVSAHADFLAFDGSADAYLEFPPLPEIVFANGFTLEAWILVSKATNGDIVYFGNNNLSRQLRFAISTVGIQVSFRLSVHQGFHTFGDAIDSVAVASPSQWAHVAVTCDQVIKEATFYLNGKAIANGDESADEANVFDSTSNTVSSAGFNGSLTGVRIYDRILSPEEINTDLGADRLMAQPTPYTTNDLALAISERPMLDNTNELLFAIAGDTILAFKPQDPSSKKMNIYWHWPKKATATPLSGLLESAGMAYCVDTESLYALPAVPADLKDPKPAWSLPVKSYLIGSETLLRPAQDVDHIYLVGNNGSYVQVRKRDGNVLQKGRISDGTINWPPVANSKLLFYNEDHYISAIDSDLNQIWQIDLSTAPWNAGGRTPEVIAPLKVTEDGLCLLLALDDVIGRWCWITGVDGESSTAELAAFVDVSFPHANPKLDTIDIPYGDRSGPDYAGYVYAEVPPSDEAATDPTVMDNALFYFTLPPTGQATAEKMGAFTGASSSRMNCAGQPLYFSFHHNRPAQLVSSAGLESNAKENVAEEAPSSSGDSSIDNAIFLMATPLVVMVRGVGTNAALQNDFNPEVEITAPPLVDSRGSVFITGKVLSTAQYPYSLKQFKNVPFTPAG